MNKHIYVNPDRSKGILTFEGTHVMLATEFVGADGKEPIIYVDEENKSITGTIEVVDIPFTIARNLSTNAMVFYDEPNQAIWMIAVKEVLFTVEIEIVPGTAEFDFVTGLFAGHLKLEKMSFRRPDFSKEIMDEIVKESARVDMETEGIADMEPKEIVPTMDLLLGGIEELASKHGWIKKRMGLPLDDDSLYEIMNDHQKEIINYFENILEIDGVRNLSLAYGYIGKENQLTYPKEIAKAKASLPRLFKRIVKLKEVQSGTVIGIMLDNPDANNEHGRTTLYSLKDMPVLAFSNMKVGRYCFEALKTHPEFSKYFIDTSTLTEIKDLGPEALEERAVLIKNGVEFIKWIGTSYEG